VQVGGKAQVVVAACAKSRGYDLETGEELWSLGGMTLNVIPTPVQGSGLVFLASGFRGSALQAVRLAGARGELDGTPAVVWSRKKDSPYVPSLLLHGDLLYLLSGNKAALTCLDAAGGKAYYTNQALPGLATVYASPLGARDRVYVVGENGTTAVVARGQEFKVLAGNKLDDHFTASPVVVGNTLYLRGHKRLYCIRK